MLQRVISQMRGSNGKRCFNPKCLFIIYGHFRNTFLTLVTKVCKYRITKEDDFFIFLNFTLFNDKIGTFFFSSKHFWSFSIGTLKRIFSISLPLYSLKNVASRHVVKFRSDTSLICYYSQIRTFMITYKKIDQNLTFINLTTLIAYNKYCNIIVY